MDVNQGFGIAIVKKEGHSYDGDGNDLGPTKPGTISEYPNIWVERSVPKEYEKEIHTLITDYLTKKGYYD